VQSGLDTAREQIRAGDLEAARLTLQEVLEFAPCEGRAWHLLGRLHQAAGAHVDALNCFSKAERMYGGSSGAGSAIASVPLAKLLWEQGDREAALAMLGLLTFRHGDDPEVRALRRAWAPKHV